MDKQLDIFKEFPASQHGPVANHFCSCIREGNKEYTKMYFYLKKEKAYRDRYNGNETVNKLFELALNNDPRIKQAFDYYIEWEKKSHAEKDKIKKEKGNFFALSSMKGKEPTDKQIAFLRAKGQEIPKDRFEASKLIDQIIKG